MKEKQHRRRSIQALSRSDALELLEESSFKSASLQVMKASPFNAEIGKNVSSTLPKIESEKVRTLKRFRQGLSQAARLLSGNKGLRLGSRPGKSMGKRDGARSTIDSVASWYVERDSA